MKDVDIANMTPELVTDQWIRNNFDIEEERQQVVDVLPLGVLTSSSDFDFAMVEESTFFNQLRDLILNHATEIVKSAPRWESPGGTLFLSMGYYYNDTVEITGEYRRARYETDGEVIRRLQKQVRSKVRVYWRKEKNKQATLLKVSKREIQERELLAKLKAKYEK